MEDLSKKDQTIMVAVASVLSIVDQRPHDMQTEPADPSICRRLIEIRQGLAHGVERPAVVAELDPQPRTIEGEGNLDPTPAGLMMAMVDGIGEELLQDDYEPDPLCGWQRVAMGETLGKADQTAEFRGVAAQAKRCSHSASIKTNQPFASSSSCIGS
jgi:hypothetical protein